MVDAMVQWVVIELSLVSVSRWKGNMKARSYQIEQYSLFR